MKLILVKLQAHSVQTAYQWKMHLPSRLFIGNKEISKNNYHETFLAYIYPALERHHVRFYLPDFITRLKYHLYRPVLKYNLFTRHPNYYKKKFLLFFTQYKNKWKEYKFWRQKKYKNKKLFKTDDIDINKILVSYGTKRIIWYKKFL